MSTRRPKRFAVEDVTCAEVTAWEAKHGADWADIVCPEERTTVWDFDTLAECWAWMDKVGPSTPAGYFGRVFERVGLHRDDETGQWDWDTKDH